MDNFDQTFVQLLIRSVEHQLASPLVAAAGYIEMVTDGALGLSPRQREAMIIQSQEAIERSIDMLSALQQLQQLERVSPKLISSNLKFDVLTEQRDDMQLVDFSMDRTYRLPSVLVDPYLLQEALANIADFIFLTRQIDQVNISFRSRTGELIVKLDAGEKLTAWLGHFRAFWQHLQTNHQLVDTLSPVMSLVMADLQLERMGASLSYAKIRSNPAAIYLHLPLANQLSLPVVSGK